MWRCRRNSYPDFTRNQVTPCVADVEARLLEAEELLGEVRAAGVGGRVLCRLLLGVGTALPKCDRHDDAVAVLTDAVHLARARSGFLMFVSISQYLHICFSLPSDNNRLPHKDLLVWCCSVMLCLSL